MQITTNTENATLLVIINSGNYNDWLTKQNEFTQNWLNSSGYEGKGLSQVASPSGGVSFVLFCCEDLTDYFAIGELPSLLPAQHYYLAPEQSQLCQLAFGWLVGSYRFEQYKQNKQSLATLAINDQVTIDKATILANGTALVRNMVNTPAADMMPQDIANEAIKLTQQFGGNVSQIIGEDLLSNNYPTIHAVGRASENQPQLIDLQWGEVNAPRVTLVGKGVCFDSGGLDLKPAAGMRYMKKDMGGSAHVLGLAHLIMANKLPVQLRVLIPAVENAVSANAMRPGDVITTRCGTTVEIDNTDAEGRLVLCDAISEAINDEPEMLIDFATLTGAMRVALGTELPGFFSTDKQVAIDLMHIGETNSDPVWNMPLHKPYKSMLRSEVADMTNCAAGPFGGHITAALYLQHFTKAHPNWLHFDIMAWNNRKLSGRPIGGEAFGIRTVYQYLEDTYMK